MQTNQHTTLDTQEQFPRDKNLCLLTFTALHFQIFLVILDCIDLLMLGGTY